MSLFCGSALLLPKYGSLIVDEYITSQLQAAVEACEYPVTTTTASQAAWARCSTGAAQIKNQEFCERQVSERR